MVALAQISDASFLLFYSEQTMEYTSNIENFENQDESRPSILELSWDNKMTHFSKKWNEMKFNR